MKLRIGFVSNSSSSSFVIGLKDRPKTWQDMHVILFGNMISRELRPDWMKPENDSYQTFFETSFAVAKNIFNQVEDQDVVPDSVLAKICDPGSYLGFPQWYEVREGKPLQEKMMHRYAIKHPYCISPTNRFWKQAQKIDARERMRYYAKIAELRKEKWAKLSPKFKGLKKFVIMTQSDAGEDAEILAIMDGAWKKIVKKVTWVQLTAH